MFSFSIGLLIDESIMLLCRTKAELKGLNLAMRAFSSCIKAGISNWICEVVYEQSFEGLAVGTDIRCVVFCSLNDYESALMHILTNYICNSVW